MRRLCWVLGWLVATAVQAAPPLAPAVQAELDRAVIAYESGQRPAARRAFESLARRGVPAAQYNLAVMHLRGEIDPPDVPAALALLQRAARGGFVTAQFMLGQVHEAGQYVPRDLARSFEWYQVAAASGSVEAQVACATAFYLGRGAPKSPAEAGALGTAKRPRAATSARSTWLASMYEQGDGVERDLRLARYWYDIAARNGDEAAPDKVKELDAKLSGS